jgi:hydroxyacylglutathione hydrolase
MPEIKPITMPFVFNVSVSCYLIRTDEGFILIDTGRTGQRRAVEKALLSTGCRPGDLKLIVLTHGDFDHCGNAAYLRQKFGAKIAMHEADSGMVERGDMLWNRNKPNLIVRTLFGLLFRLGKADRFKPDVCLKEGDDLAGYGLAARIVALPGHSRGSIGLLTTSGDLFCGDLLANTKKPEVWSIIDDRTAMDASVKRLADLGIKTVYPGHGRPFLMEQFRANS